MTGTNGNNVGADEGSVYLDNVTGTLTVTGSQFSGGAEDTFHVRNTTNATLNATISGNTFSAQSATGNVQLLIKAQGNATIDADVANNTFTGARNINFQAALQDTADMDVTFTGNTIGSPITQISGAASVLVSGGSGAVNTTTLVYNISNNTITGAKSSAIVVGLLGGTSSGKINDNNIGSSGVVDSGSKEGSGIGYRVNYAGTHTAQIDGNDIYQYGNYGIHIELGDTFGGDPIHNLTISDNVIKQPGTLSFIHNGIHVNNGLTDVDDFVSNIYIINNDITDSGDTQDLRIRQRFQTGIILSGYGGSISDNTAVQNHLAAQNDPISTPVVLASHSVGAAPPLGPGKGFLGGPVPPLPGPMLLASEATAPGLGDQSKLSQADAEFLLAAAVDRWSIAGATAEQTEAMRAVSIVISDGAALGYGLGSAIRIDDDAAGHGWFVDPTPLEDGEFEGEGSELAADPGGAAEGKVDLLTVIMHELGHQIGLEDSYDAADADGLMYGYLDLGERQLPEIESGAALVQGWKEAPAADAPAPAWIAALAADFAFPAARLDALAARFGPGDGPGGWHAQRDSFAPFDRFDQDPAFRADPFAQIPDRVL